MTGRIMAPAVEKWSSQWLGFPHWMKMELEFDKEMDAILRKARGGSGVSVTTAHLDADTIAAFVENALPDSSRRISIGHFADCDPCRKQLSQTILLNETAASTADVGAADLVGVATAEPSWISRLFRTPNLAIAMGALVLGFSGIIGYIALQNREGANSTISQASNKSMPSSAAARPAMDNATNVPANSAEPGTAAANVPTNSGVSASNPVAVGESKTAQTANESRTETGGMSGGVPANSIVPARPAPAAPITTTRESTADFSVDGAASEPVKRKDEDKEVASSKSDNYDDRSRNGAPKLSAKKPEVGPSRQSGNVQNQQNNMIYDIRVPTRSVGGRTFENRNGVWTDSAYRDQATTVIKRNTDNYKKLDKGIRSIADQLGGTVIVMSGQRAYRIQ